MLKAVCKTTAALCLAVGLVACGTSTEVRVANICNGYSSALNLATVASTQGMLNAEQESVIDLSLAIVEPVCGSGGNMNVDEDTRELVRQALFNILEVTDTLEVQ